MKRKIKHKRNNNTSTQTIIRHHTLGEAPHIKNTHANIMNKRTNNNKIPYLKKSTQTLRTSTQTKKTPYLRSSSSRSSGLGGGGSGSRRIGTVTGKFAHVLRIVHNHGDDLRGEKENK